MGMARLDKQTAILDAAQKRFSFYGFTKVTMDEIAEDLGISKAALYYYFPAKEELFRQVIARGHSEFFDLVEDANKTIPVAGEKILRYFQLYLAFFNKLLNLNLISVNAVDIIHPIIKNLFVEFTKKEYDLIESILHEGKKNNEFKIDSPQKTTVLLQHIMQGLRMRFFKAARNRDHEEFDLKMYENDIRLFSKIFLVGIGFPAENACL
jgi:TetR/AcrR family transcriptional regulator